MKLTKRKGFNFFRSFYDVYNELNNDDKVAFMDALLDRQFLGVKPENLKGMAKFAYISQTNSIDSQIKGYEDKTKTKLDGTPYSKEITPPIEPPADGVKNTPIDGGNTPPTLQVEEKGKEKGKGKGKVQDVKNYSEKDFFLDWNDLRTEHLKKPSFINSMGGFDAEQNFNKLKRCYSRSEIKNALIGLFKQKKLPNGNTQMQSNPKHFLSHFEQYHTAYHDKNNALYGEFKETA